METKRVVSLSPSAYAGLKRVEVFKTNVEREEDAHYLLLLLFHRFPSFDVHFDLEDCDHILRIEGGMISNDLIISFLSGYGYECVALV
ncbi:MAG: hypothetical protein H7282_15695 [Cytophagaceae bacterium]|nr:hypothetical protein [Cytophagaceae bacterium]